MVGGGLMAIFFVCVLACFAVSTGIYVIFASHYFLTTLTESSSGQDEVHYPSEGIFDWWWKPILCLWVLLFWLVPATLLLSPLLIMSPMAFLIPWGTILWIAFPLSLASSLYAQSWMTFMHGGVIGRMLHHLGAFIYVHLVTVSLFAGCAWLIQQGISNFVWLIPAVIVAPAVQLLYARHWGRFAWLSLNFLPKHQRGGAKASAPAVGTGSWGWENQEDHPPEIDSHEAASEVESPADPPARPVAPPASASQAEEDVDEWTDFRPYTVVDDPSLPVFAEEAAPPSAPADAPAAPAKVAAEEEDEWATEKKPYAVEGPNCPIEATPAPSAASKTTPDANTPVTMSQYHARRRKKEEADKRKREREMRTMPKRSKKTPTFGAAFLAGVWKFMFYPSTLLAWGNLAVVTLVEFFLLWLLVQFMPKVG